MPWSGGTFSLNQNFPADRDAGVPDKYISADKMDNELQNIKGGLENCVTRDGQNSPSADLPMSTRKHTNVGEAAALTQYARADQVQKGTLNYLTSVGGTANAITATAALSMAALTVGQLFWFIPGADNTTTTPTLNINAIGAGTITKNGGDALVAGDIQQNWPALVQRVSGGFELLNPYSVVGGQIDASSVTTALLDATAADSLGYRGAPQNGQDGAYTFVAADAGKVVRCNSGTGRTYTIPPNSSVAFPVGTIINVRNVGSASLTIAQGFGVTLRQAGTTNTGNRTLAQHGEVSLRKDATDTWYVSGAGLS